MITVPPRHYCVIENPVLRDAKTGHVVYDDFGQAKLRHADLVSNKACSMSVFFWYCEDSTSLFLHLYVGVHLEESNGQ